MRLPIHQTAHPSEQAPRKLVWKKNLGTVRLKVTIGGVDRDFSVSPLHARSVRLVRSRPSFSAPLPSRSFFGSVRSAMGNLTRHAPSPPYPTRAA